VIVGRPSKRAVRAVIVQVASLSRLQRLSLDQSAASSVIELSKLTVLDYRDTRVSDAGVARLKGLTSLSHLVLSDTRVIDAGSVNLKGLTKLRESRRGHRAS
jgi:hypothetical protein